MPPTTDQVLDGLRAIKDQRLAPGWTSVVQSGIDEIERLTDAIWEYGQHRPNCRIGGGQECDCGFFDIIKTLKE